ncbi:hypothetical protein H6P81_006566 [Aristolochia fimbriata]|uniref:RING-type E3 ubiquitin transferase n=1 Tax=Aristolochia fimbriata TaxID=158543 RepID=A0AAV7F1J5_ARIFI|nr:hypothetical protein H6P81_006566 [Aristolochia fimbriata]
MEISRICTCLRKRNGATEGCIILSPSPVVRCHGWAGWPLERRVWVPYSRHLSVFSEHIPAPYSPESDGHRESTKEGTILENEKQSYCKLGLFSNARRLFDETTDWEVISATAIIGHLTRQGHLEDAVYVFSRMLFLGIGPNDFTFSTLIHSCTELKCHSSGKQLHAAAIKVGLQTDVFVGSSVMDHYAKFGSIGETERVFEDIHQPNVVSYTALIGAYMKNEMFEEALRLFRNMPERNVVSWNAIISAFSQMGHNEEAVNLFVEMCREGVEPNDSTFPCVFTAAANITALGMGKSFHAYAIKTLVKQDVYVTNSLISFYAKCGHMEDSLLVFDRLSAKNVVSWNALICGYAQNGRGNDALELFQRMKKTGFRPNEVTLLCLLFACNHAGLVKEGYAYFDQTRREEAHLLQPEHYACAINLLSRSGLFEEAKRILQELPFDPGIGFWKALLGGTQVHPNTDLADLAAKKILALDPEDSSSYVLLSNLYSAVGKWKKASMVRKEMREKGMKKVPGCSWIQIRNKVHLFVNREIKHLQGDDEIYRLLREKMQPSPSPSPPAYNPTWNPLIISLVATICTIFLLLSYYNILRKHCPPFNRSFRRNRDQRHLLNEANHDNPSSRFQSQGVEPSILEAIPASQYRRKEGNEDDNGNDCSVCLGEFGDGDWMRMLPRCSHTFHALCVDTWFQSHSTCPLCRSNVLSASAKPPCDSSSSSSPVGSFREEGIQRERVRDFRVVVVASLCETLMRLHTEEANDQEIKVLLNGEKVNHIARKNETYLAHCTCMGTSSNSIVLQSEDRWNETSENCVIQTPNG